MTIHLVIMGVCGCGKTTLATALSERSGWDYFEADDFHPQSNVDKMSAGIPLNDDDRRPWLESLRDQMSKNAAAGKNSIVSCSALKKIYRNLLSEADGEVYFLHIHGSETLLRERLENRKGHFMPPALLPSQLATLEPLQKEEHGTVIPLELSPAEQCSAALTFLAQLPLSNLAIIGAGVMGAALAKNFATHGLKVGLYDHEQEKAQKVAAGQESQFFVAQNLADLVANCRTPRVIFLVVPAGEATDNAIEALTPFLDKDDVLIDLGNTYFTDTQQREKKLQALNIHFAGCGMSGGEAGARHGAALMFGGSEHAFKLAAPLLHQVAAKAEDGKPCFAHIGADGAGHYVKMIHNGIEYADMQLLAEGYFLARESGKTPTEIGAWFQNWQRGTLNSYLLEISAAVLMAKDLKTAAAMVDVIDDRAGQKGTGSWTSQNAFALSVPVNMIAEATLFRALSTCTAARESAQTTFAASTNLPLPYQGDLATDLEKALIVGKILAYAQGFMQIQQAAKTYGWQIDLAELALIWRAGCIIRAEILQNIAAAFSREPQLAFLGADPYFAKLLTENLPAGRKIAAWAVENGFSVPTLTAGLCFFDALRTENLPTALIQGQRDYFGAHGYARRDAPNQRFHRLWTGDESEITL